MKRLNLLVVGIVAAISFWSTASNAQAQGTAGRLVTEIGVYGVRSLSFFEPNGKSAKLMLGEDGLFLDSKKVCTWPEGKFKKHATVPQTLVNCRVNVPFRIFRGKFEDAMEIPVSKKDGAKYYVPYDGSELTLTLDIKGREIVFIESQEYRANQSKAAKNNPRVQELRAAILKCLRTKRSMCLRDQFESSQGNAFATLYPEEDNTWSCGHTPDNNSYTADEVADCVFMKKGGAIRDALSEMFSTGFDRLRHVSGYNTDGSEDYLEISHQGLVVKIAPVQGRMKVVSMETD